MTDDMYSFVEAFAADIRLTFSNAKRYNPAENVVHLMAKELNDLFDKSWRSFEAKLLKLRKKFPEQSRSKKNLLDTSKICNGLPVKTLESTTVKKQGLKFSVKLKKTEDTSKITTTTCSIEKPLISCEEKVKLKKELMVALSGEFSGPLCGFLRKYGLVYSRPEKIESIFGSFGDYTLRELKRVLKGSLSANMEKKKSNIESRIRAARAAKEAILESAKSDWQMKRDRERERE